MRLIDEVIVLYNIFLGEKLDTLYLDGIQTHRGKVKSGIVSTFIVWREAYRLKRTQATTAGLIVALIMPKN